MNASQVSPPPAWMQRVLQRACAQIASQWPLRESFVTFAMYLTERDAGPLPLYVKARDAKPVQFRARLEFLPVVVKVYDAWSGELVCQSLPGLPDRIDPEHVKQLSICE